MKPRSCLWWLQSTRSHTRHTYRSLLRERPTRPHAAHLVFHCLDLSKDPIWSSCVYPESPFSTRDWRHLCRSPPCSPCFLHIKNLLVVLLDLFFHSGAPRGFAKKLAQLRRGCPQSQCKSRATCPISTSSKSRPKPRVHDSTTPAFCLLEAAVHIANTQKLLNNLRWLSLCRASTSKCGLLQHVMSELTLFLMCSRLACP